MKWFTKTEKTNEELQAELKALVMLCSAKQYISYEEGKRYEALLKEIYLRGLTPELILKHFSKK